MEYHQATGTLSAHFRNMVSSVRYCLRKFAALATKQDTLQLVYPLYIGCMLYDMKISQFDLIPINETLYPFISVSILDASVISGKYQCCILAYLVGSVRE